MPAVVIITGGTPIKGEEEHVPGRDFGGVDIPRRVPRGKGGGEETYREGGFHELEGERLGPQGGEQNLERYEQRQRPGSFQGISLRRSPRRMGR
jgi:hypothetical protein